MFKTILVANDGSEHAFDALSLALEIARESRAELHMVSVEEIPHLPETIEEVQEEKGATDRRFHSVLNRARAMAKERDVKLQTHVVSGNPVRHVIALAADLKTDLLVVGASGHSALHDRMVGSRADRIVHLSSCPVLVVRPLSPVWRTPIFKRILHANDGSDHAFHALSLTLSIAKEINAELHMISVEEIPYIPETIEEVREETGVAARRFHSVINHSRAMAEECHVKLKTHVVAGHPVRDIVDLAHDLKAELLVVGASGHSALYDRMIGSRADRIVHLAPCPVLVVK
jgi:nucleotide-binding universal stress UspA family protein